MPTEINELYINAILSDATYALGITTPDGASPSVLTTLLSERMTPELAKYIGENFTVVTHHESDDYPGGSGFDATVWKRNSDGKYFISMQGSLGLEDWIADYDLTVSGAARSQICDMINWWLQITTPENTEALQVGKYDGEFFVADPVMGTGLLQNITSISEIKGVRDT